MDHFGISLFLAVLTSDRYFGNYEKYVCFLKKAISGKIVADFQSFKMSSRSPKIDFGCPSKVLNKLLSRNPTLTRRCEVNKFNLVTLYKYQRCGSLITQFSRPRAATILSSFSLVFPSSSSFFLFSTNKLLIIY